MLLTPDLFTAPFFSESDAYFNSLDQDYVKQNGIAYTPKWLAEHITESAFLQWQKFNRGKKADSVADICCGTGVFISEMLTQIKNRDWPTKVIAYDVDNGALNVAKKFFVTNENLVNIEQKDSILEVDNLFAHESALYDIIVGNPPYVNSSQLKESYRDFIRSNYVSAAKGSFDLSIIFIEKILKALKEGGVASVILSNKFMTSAYGKNVCNLLATNCNIIKIEDFNDLQVFKGLTTYTCILTFIKSKPGKRHTLVRYFGNEERVLFKIPRFLEETIPHEKLLQHPWNFHSEEEDSIHKKLSDKNLRSLLQVFTGIQQGVRTGANDVFLIDSKTAEKLNSDLVKKYISGENIKTLTIDQTDQYIIYPYIVNSQGINQIRESELEKKFYSVYLYLSNRKDNLKARSLQGNTQWFEFSRSQSLDVLNKPKIFVREMMPSAIFSADLYGNFVFSNGYALTCENMSTEQITAWTAVLATQVMEFFMRHIGTQLHSGWFRLMKNHLLNLKLPNLSKDDFEKVNEIITKNPIGYNKFEINDIVASAFGLTKHEVEYIQKFLSEIHKKSLPNSKTEEASTDKFEPVKLEQYNRYHVEKSDLRQEVTFSQNKKIPIHNWYKYTQGFSTSLVNQLLDLHNLPPDACVLDPFNGCGTTVVTCAYRGIDSIGIEISPLMSEVARIKSRKWDLSKLNPSIVNSYELVKNAEPQDKLIFEDYFIKAYSPKVLQKIKKIAGAIKFIDDSELRDFYSIALLSILEDVSKIRKHGSHYRFLDNTSSVGLQKLNISVIDDDEDIFMIFKEKLDEFYSDLCITGGNPKGRTRVINCSSLKSSLKDKSIDLVITSPPYLNRNNYISQQKAELDLLQIIANKIEYKALVKSTFRSHTDSDLNFEPISKHDEVNKIVKEMVLEEGNNPKIPHMICGYFEDMDASLNEIHRLLKPGGKASIVVGNTRWGGIVVPIDHIISLIAEKIGFKIESIFVTRLKGNSPQQMKKFGKISVRESIVNIVK